MYFGESLDLSGLFKLNLEFRRAENIISVGGSYSQQIQLIVSAIKSFQRFSEHSIYIMADSYSKLISYYRFELDQLCRDPNTFLINEAEDICEKISPEYIAGNLDLLQNADAVVIDANLPEETIRYICAHTDRPIFADPVSTAKAGRLKASLGKIRALKPNRLEAEILSGIPIRDEKSLEKAAKVLLESGLEQVYISLGKDGIFAGVKEENSPDRFFRVPAIPVKVKNATGAGDAFMAGLVKGYLKGLCPEESAVYALKAATITIEGSETINSELSEEKIKSC